MMPSKTDIHRIIDPTCVIISYRELEEVTGFARIHFTELLLKANAHY